MKNEVANYAKENVGFYPTPPAGDRLYQQHGKDNHMPDTETCKFIDAWVKRAKKIRKDLVKNAG